MAHFITKDGRNLTKEEWRKIPEFPLYKITADGDLRSIETGNLLSERESSNGGYYYSLRKRERNGQTKWFQRGYKSLVWDAFPELRPAPKLKDMGPKRMYVKRGNWRGVPGYPKVEVHPDGAVRYAVSRKRMKPQKDVGGTPYVTLRNDSGDYRWSLSKLIALAFPELGIEVVEETVDTGWKSVPGYEMYEINKEGQLRHKVRKMLLVRHDNGMYRLNVGGKKPFWCEGELGNQEDWEAFWNEAPTETEEAA